MFGPPAAFNSIFPHGPFQTPPTGNRHLTDLAGRVQKWLAWATAIAPAATLAYALTDVRVGVNYFHMSPLLAAVVAFLFTATTTPLIGPVGAGNRRAIGVTAGICSAYSWVFGAASFLFLFFTLSALTRVFGIRYFVTELDNPILTTFLVGLLTTLSASAYFATRKSASLLKSLLA